MAADTTRPCPGCGETWDYHTFRQADLDRLGRTPRPDEIRYSPECPTRDPVGGRKHARTTATVALPGGAHISTDVHNVTVLTEAH